VFQKKQKEDKLEIFASAPVPKAVLTNGIPAMIAMLMVLIYNIADTFFVGQTNDALMVAAVSLASPVFLVFMGVGNVFGIGGTSVISRALGEGRKDYAKKVSSFCMWSCVVLGVVLSALLLLFMDPVLRMIGASGGTWAYTKEYLTIVAFAGPFSLIANCYSNVIRTEGRPGIAMTGQIAGNLLNVVLDPILILAFGMGVAGAAWATTIGNVVSSVFYVSFLSSRKSILSIRPRDFSMSGGIFTGVMAIGVPAALGNLLMSAAHILSNAKLASYNDDLAVAGYGVATKMAMITGILCIGFGQGVQPLLGYCIGAKNYPRFKKSLKMAVGFDFCLALLLTALCFVFVRPLTGVFLTDPVAHDYAIRFSRVLLSSSYLFGVFYVLLSSLQAMGAAGRALIVNLSRQGFVYIPAIIVLNALFGMYGLIWAQPMADVVSTVLVAILYLTAIRRVMRSAAERAA
jgi:putative MATE family efflux protein